MKSLLPQLERACEHGGETGALIRVLDWSKTPLGPIASWPASLQLTVSICLRTKFPMVINWGVELAQIYNDAARRVYGQKHPAAMGQPARTNFPEFWELTIVEQLLEQIRQSETPFQAEDQWVPVQRWGFLEETFFTFGLSPLLGDDGALCGVLNTFMETTNRVLGERRLATMQSLAEHVARAANVDDTCHRAMAALATNPRDLRFVLLYLDEPESGSAVLKGANRIKTGMDASPTRARLHEAPWDGAFAWPIGRVIETVESEIVEDLEQKVDLAAALEQPPSARKRTPPRRAMVLPLVHNGEKRAAGALIVGLSPRLVHDEAYLSFLRLLSNQLAVALAGARAYQETRERAEQLAELDRAKSVFYSNISHEFRTPLTLLLAPVEDMLGGRSGEISAPLREGLETIRRNTHRLLKLVNGLLDFARIKAGRMELQRGPTDLAALTRELVSAFELAVRRSGLELTVDCPPLPRPVYVDPEAWAKIVSNLLSNALKYTRRGKIVVSLRAVDEQVKLVVHDTGVGVAAADLPHIFERFYRARGSAGRSVEGAGIGLALVDALVKLHGGSTTAASTPGRGTVITVTLPVGRPTVAEAHGAPAQEPNAAGSATTAWVEEATGWMEERLPEPAAAAAADEPPSRRRILVAEDNADMRQYLVKLLSADYDVEAVSNGEAARAAAESRVPDLVLSDVLMPGLDGYALLRALRLDPRMTAVPVLLLSAQASEEAALEALGGGADDYLRKPFSVRELLARVRTHLELADARRTAAEYHMMDAFLGIVAHELRTPVTTLKIVWQSLQRAFGESGSPLATRLKTLGRAVGRIEVLIEDIVSVAAIKSGQFNLKLVPYDLTAICREGADEQATSSSLPVVLDLPDEPVVALVDDVRVLEIVTNLLSNARKFSPPNRPVVLSLRRIGDEAHIAVRDEGPGIPRDELPHLFDRFHRVPGIRVQSGSQTGLGLGLYICKGIVDQHHGRIWAETAVGRGSTFHVVLPIKPAISESVAGAVPTGDAQNADLSP